MSSSLVLERPGRWRVVGISAVLLVLVSPGLPLILTAALSPAEFEGLRPFGAALANSGIVALCVAIVSFLVGLPAGILFELYDFKLRKLLLALVCLPLLVPSFLWGLGWSMLGERLSLIGAFLRASPHAGCTLTFLSAAVGLTTLTSYAATFSLTRSQIDAARLAGGETAVFFESCKNATIPVVLASALAGILTLSDPGPGQLVGLRTGASDVLVSFAAQNDFDLAAIQCLALALLVLVLAMPLSWVAGRRLSAQVLGRQLSGPERATNEKVQPVALGVLGAAVLLLTVAPALGLALPLLRTTEFRRALAELARTGGNTFVYAFGAGFLAAVLGLILTLCVGRDWKRCVVVVALSLAVFSLPPSLSALGALKTASQAPPWLDLLLRSRFTVCALLALRLVPIALFVLLRAWGSTSASWAFAAAVSGVPLGKYVGRVVLPLLLPAAGISILLVALVASAEIGTVLLLAPPGEGTFPLAIFTVMANAPESLVASLCLLYLATAAVLLVAVMQICSRSSAAART